MLFFFLFFHCICRMEETFKRVKTQRDELIKVKRDSLESPKRLSVDDEIIKLRNEMEIKQRTYEAQFIEYVST